MRFVSFFAIALALLGTTVANAITISASVSPPTLNIVESATTQDGAAAGNNMRNLTAGPNHEYSGEIFMHATNFTIDTITYRITSGAAAVAGQPVNVELWSVPGGAAAASGGAVLQTDSGTLPAVLNNGDYVTFDITDYAATGGSFYVIMPDLTTTNATNSATWASNGPNGTYTNGQLLNFEPTNSNDWDSIGDDLLFYVTQPVPEPSSFILGGLGLVGLVACARRRKSA